MRFSFRCERRTFREVLIFRHYELGHLKAASFRKTTWLWFWQINRSLVTAFMGWNCPATTQ